MIVILLSYKVEPAEIDRLRPAHVDWLKRELAAGKLLVAGRQVPPTGGMLIFRGTLDEARAWAAEDPFATEGAADYQFVAVTPSILAPGLEALAQ